jgi:excisionase family DNA binding protein
MNEKIFTTYQAANICNVHLTTVINWINEGALKAYATPGGHRRIKEIDILKFMKKHRIPIPKDLKKETKLVLIVDDDPIVLEEFREALSGEGFDLDFASDGFEAGRKIYKKKPDLILLDFKMPGIDGFQVCEILHKDKETTQIPIIAVTVLNSEEDIRRIKKCGVKKYIPKPMDIEKLLISIKDILDIEDEALQTESVETLATSA